MWPFEKKQPREQKVVTIDGVDVKHAAYCDMWEFTVDGLDFTIDGPEFDQRAVEWAKDAVPTIRRLEREMVKAARERVKAHQGLDLDSTELLSVDLSDFEKEGYLSAAYVGDESWGDMGVVVTIQDGKILDVRAGD